MVSLHATGANTVRSLSLNGRGQLGYILPLLVLVISLVVTYHLWTGAQYQAAQSLQADFDFRVHETTLRIKQRLLAYEQVLRGAQGLFGASASVGHDDFHRYVANLHLEENYPGIQGVGFSRMVPSTEVSRHIAATRKDSGHPEFRIWPEGERSTYSSIIYLEPFSDRNLRAFGYDMYSEPVRRAAMEQARDSGRASLSGKVKLVQETEENIQPGFLIYLPVYRKNAPINTLVERRANIIGWVYASFRMHDLMQGIKGVRPDELDVEIYDGDGVSNQALMYDTDTRLNDHLAARFKNIAPFVIAGHRWTLLIHSYPPFEAHLDTHKAKIIALAGVMASLLLALLTWSLARGRERAEQAARKMNQELLLSEERTRLAIAASHSAMWDYDLTTDRVYLAEGWSQFIGGEAQARFVTSQELIALTHEEDREILKAAIVKAVKADDSSLYQVSYRVKRPDGSHIWLLSEGEVIERDSNGRALRLMGISRNITERKLVEIELEQIRERYDYATEVGKVGVWDWNPATGKLAWSDETFRLMGYVPDSVTPTYELFLELLDPADRETLNSAVQAALSENKPYDLDCRIRLGSGQELTCHVTGKVEFDVKNQPVRMLGTIQDITEHNILKRQMVDQLAFTQAVINCEVNGLSVCYGIDEAPFVHFTVWNPSMEVLTGYSIEEINHLGWYQTVYIAPDVQEKARQRMDRMRQGEHLLGEEWTITRKNGECRIVQIHTRTIAVEGAKVHVLAAMQDITERKQAELALLESESRFREIFNAVDDAIFIHDAETGRILDVNRRMCEMYGLSREQAFACSLDDLSAGISPYSYVEALEKIRLATLIGPQMFDWLARAHDGHLFWVEIGLRTARIGSRQRILAVVRDISERKQTEEVLRKLSIAVEQSPASVVITDLDACIQYVNPRFTEVTGYSAEEAIGQNPRIFQSGQTSKEIYLELWDRISRGKTWQGELVNKRKDGELYWEETHIAPVNNSAGEVTHYVAVKTDISERKRIEKELQENEQRYHLLFDSSPMPMWVFEESSLKFLEVNERAIAHYGYTREEFTRMNLRDIRPAEDVPALERIITNSPDRRVVGEWRHMQKNGNIIHVSVTSVPMMYGDIPARIALIQDITERKRAEKELWDKTRLLEAIIENIPNMIFLKRASDLRFELFNRAGEMLLGHDRSILLGQNDYDFFPQAQADFFAEKDREVLQRHDIMDIPEEPIATPRGTRILHTKKLTLRDENGQPQHLLGISEDITEHKSNLEKLQKSEARLRAILDNVPYLIWQKDMDGRFVAVNKAFFNTTGQAHIQEVLGKTDLDLWPQKLAEKYRADDAEVLSTRKQKLTEEMFTDKGEIHWVETFKAPIMDRDGNLLGTTGFAQDVTTRKNAEGKIRHLAHYDPLTDLPNRTLFSDRLQQALAIAKRDRSRLALMFIDLDKFKPINDELGHHVGDLLLKEAAKRMQDSVRESDTVARIGGDEFVVLLPIIEMEQDAVLVADKIRGALNQPFVLVGKALNISSSTGIAVYPEHGKDETQLMKNADIAMYYAKENGRNSVRLYSNDLTGIVSADGTIQ